MVPLETSESYILCLNQNTWLLVQMLHSFYGSWRNRYSQNVDVATPLQPTDEQWNLVMNIFDQGERELSQVSCLDDIVNAINGIRDEIAEANQNATNNTSGNGGCGCVMSGDTDITETSDIPPVEEGDREGDPPPGNETWDEFDQHKCDQIHKILADYVATLRNYGGFFGLVGGLTVAVIVGVTLITLPPLGMALLMSALGGLLTIDITAFAYFTTIADEIEGDEDILCELYNSPTTDDMVGVMYALLTEIIPGLVGMPPGVESRLIDACQAMNTNTLWQPAIENGGLSPAGYEGSVCDCGGDPIAFITSFYCEATVLEGEFASGEETTIESCLSGSEIIGAIRHQIALQTIDYPANALMEIVSISAGDYIVSWNDGATPQTPETYGSAAATAGWTNSASALQVSRWTENVTTVPFTITVRITTE